MRKRTLPLLLLLLFISTVLTAQVVDVYAGNDTIELRLGNYQYGFIQWQTSQDTVHWENIEGATDTVYRFLPKENAYYRALAFFENCPDVTSRVCYVQVPPKADAGPDRKLMEGSGATMLATMGDGCMGRWEVIEGANGMLDDPNSPNSYFEGTDREYKLKWTVTNACGSDSDTITISYRQAILNENYIVVDTTDVLLSDSTQLVNGEYLIAFSEPVVLNDSMLLCGMGEQSFLRKIVSYTYDSEMNVYDIETEQASAEDFLIDGVLSYDLKAMMRRGKVVFSHRYPTRKDIAELGFDGMFFRLPDKSDNATSWVQGQKGWKVNWTPGPLTLPGYIVLDPDFDLGTPDIIFEMERDFFEVTHLKVGIHVDYHYSFRIGLPSATGVTIKKDDLPLVKFPIPLPPIGPIPVDFTFDVTYGYKGSLTLDSEMTYELSKNGSLTHYIEYTPSVPGEWTKHYIKDTRPMECEVLNKPMEYADVSFGGSLAPGISLVFGKVVSLYLQLDVVAEEKFNVFGEGFNSGEFRFGLDLAAGLKAKINKKKIFDLKYTHPLLTFFEYKDPASIHYFSGNQQVFDPDNHLPEPIAVQLRNSRGKPSSGTRVKFETEDGYFTNDKVFTNGNGVAFTNWICGNNPTGVVTARAIAFNAKHEPIENAPVVFRAFHGNSSIPDCLHSTLAVTADVSSGLLAPRITGGFTPYRYSITGSSISGASVIPVLPQPGATYHISVWDAFDCYTECYYTHPMFDCFSSGLQLRVEQQGNTVTATAQGGKSPYQFCLDDGSYSSTSIFQNLNDGRHVVYVRDDNGCEEAKVITVSTNGGGSSSGSGSVIVTTSPTVEVMDVTSAHGSGSVRFTGDATVLRCGLCWSQHHAPTTSDEYVQNAYSGNSFGNLMVNLTPNVLYYLRAFVVTNTGTVYGNEVGFSTTAVAPVVTCGGVGNTTSTSVRALGNVSNISGTFVTERGFCWSRNHNPTISGSHLACGFGTGIYSCNITGLDSDTPYYLRAYATNSVGTSYSEEVEFLTGNNGGGGGGGAHEYVDLGLPSGTLWATCNVGANSPEEYGDYFAWGETQPKTTYDWSTYKYGDYELTKYCNDSYYGYNGYTDNLTVLQPGDDAATANWGNGWCMPTYGQWEELYQNTTHTWTTQNGVNGRLFTATNGNSLFLPAAGYRWDDELYNVGSYGGYWSSTLYTGRPVRAWTFYFNSDYYDMGHSDRFYGSSVRAVHSARQD